jgi:hypothetical protein
MTSFPTNRIAVMWLVVRQVHARPRHSRGIPLVAPVLSLFPVHYFFSAMYYTDISSTYVVIGSSIALPILF